MENEKKWWEKEYKKKIKKEGKESELKNVLFSVDIEKIRGNKEE